jgi:hypothetical protein
MMAKRKSLREASINELDLLWDTCNRMIENSPYPDEGAPVEEVEEFERYVDFVNTNMVALKCELARRGLEP